MKNRIACHSCDLLVELSQLSEGDKAYCPRCKGFLTRLRADFIDHSLAYTIAATVFLALACSFPFLSFAASGLESVMTLPQTALALYEYGMHTVALVVAAFIMVIPAFVLLLLLLVCLPLQLGRQVFWLEGAGRWLFSIYNWAMAEVFIIGVIVSLVKIAKMADVTLGLAFWAYAAFSIFFTLALASMDRFQVWRQIARVQGLP